MKKHFFSSIKYIFVTICALLYLFPFLFVVLNSLKKKIEILRFPLSLPTEFSFINYVKAAGKMNYFNAISNSLIVTILGTIILTVFPSMLAYYLERCKGKYNNKIFYVLVASMIIPFQAVMIPFVAIYGKLGLLSSRLALVYFYLGFGLAFASFLYKGFIAKLPISLDESGAIEGASKFTIFWKIIFPQLKPITATIAVLNVLWLWNDYLLPSLVLFKKSRTLPLTTYSFFGKYTSDYGLAMAGLVLSIIPVIIFYIIMQKQIVSGVTDGAIK